MTKAHAPPGDFPAARFSAFGNVAMMLVFGAASSPRYFTPLLLAAYVATSAALRAPGGALGHDGPAHLGSAFGEFVRSP